ncbi:hypothetical protein QO002_004615 [Pararhizobium capsulatum DSM 1112]|uniref:Uncharacterized protein n=1 Tax=Pararhizobium capsulatum DSM 1112 TaxID=1121113 RepID=A0ABU0BVY0_9HYPH|nr:hypothetical protein [Pararhizobium capsulatum]MDQ0322409.1 hypothetical protein [Pararhizobium capsulatum DSM 1112]
MRFLTIPLAIAGLSLAAPSFAGEAEYLASLQGTLKGTGFAKLRTNRAAISLTCTFTSVAKATSLSLSGTCRSLGVFKRNIDARLNVTGSRYRGTYTGAASGPATLSGKRSGQTIQLQVLWSKEINGDKSADMRIERTSGNGIRIVTIDRDPESGKSVVTSQIDLRRG